MNRLLRLFFLLALAISGQVLAATVLKGSTEQPSPHGQRRAELKAALESQRQNSARETPRQLSPDERTTLRQQLRQQHEAGSRKP